MKKIVFRPLFVLLMGGLFLLSELISINKIDIVISILTILILISYIGYLRRLPLIMVCVLTISSLIIYFFAGNYEDVKNGLNMNSSVLTIFIFVPFISIPIQIGKYFEDVSKYLKTIITRPNQMYLSLKLTTFSLGSILNMGTIPIIYYLSESFGKGKYTETKLKAINRGFSLAFMWSPYFISIAVILNYFDVKWIEIAVFGILYSLIGLGYAFILNIKDKSDKLPLDRIHNTENINIKKIKELLFIIINMTTIIVILDLLIYLPILTIIPIVSIVTAILWSLYLTKFKTIYKGFITFTQEKLPTMGNELLLFISAGLFGNALMSLALDEMLIAVINALQINHVLLLILTFSIIVNLLSFTGVHPIVTVTIISLSINNLTYLNEYHYLLSLGLLLSWMTTIIISPFSGVNLILSGLSRKNPYIVGPRYNFCYGSIMWGIGYLLIIILYFVFY